MPRDPKPPSKIVLKGNLSKIILTAVKNNSSIRDGAIMIKMDCNPPIITGFSFRLYPPSLASKRKVNKGSGYNSAIDFSYIDGVICVYFINNTCISKFIKGEEVELC